MSKLSIFVSATIVLIFLNPPLFASPLNEVPPAPQEKETWPTTPLDEDLSIAKPPPLQGPPPRPDARYYAYQQQLTFRFGRATDLHGVYDNVTGFQYLFPKFLSPKLEAGADLHDNGIGHLHAGARWIYFERSYFRPSLKLSLDHKANSTYGLATLTYIDNYYIRASAALEYVVWNPYSLRLEQELLVGKAGNIMELTLGLSRGW